MYMCARGIHFASFYDCCICAIFVFGFETVPTLCYFCIWFWNCSDIVLFLYLILKLIRQCGIFVFGFETVPTVWYFCSSFYAIFILYNFRKLLIFWVSLKMKRRVVTSAPLLSFTWVKWSSRREVNRLNPRELPRQKKSLSCWVSTPTTSSSAWLNQRSKSEPKLSLKAVTKLRYIALTFHLFSMHMSRIAAFFLWQFGKKKFSRKICVG